MNIDLTRHEAATLLFRLASSRLSPVAESAAKHERSLRRLILDAVEQARAAVPMTELIDVLSLGHPGTGAPLYILEPSVQVLVTQLLGDGVTTYPDHRTRIKTLAATLDVPDILLRALRSGAKARRFRMAFDELNPEVLAWVEAHSVVLVTNVSESIREAIRALVAEGFSEGIAPRELARLIRGAIGLTQRDALAVVRRHHKMIADGVSYAKARESDEKYAAKLLRRRALNIARTETMAASNEGQQQLWNQARSAGLLSTDVKKTWITADPCPICAALDGETVSMNGDFSIGSNPPAHPNCRCTIALVNA